MRHFCLSGTVTALARGVFVAAKKARLIALPGSFKGMGAGQLRAVASAVALATVASATDKHRCVAANAEIVSSRRFHRQ